MNVPDAKQVAIVDRKSRSVVATWPMNDFLANYPMALDEANRSGRIKRGDYVLMVVFGGGLTWASTLVEW